MGLGSERGASTLPWGLEAGGARSAFVAHRRASPPAAFVPLPRGPSQSGAEYGARCAALVARKSNAPGASASLPPRQQGRRFLNECNVKAHGSSDGLVVGWGAGLTLGAPGGNSLQGVASGRVVHGRPDVRSPAFWPQSGALKTRNWTMLRFFGLAVEPMLFRREPPDRGAPLLALPARPAFAQVRAETSYWKPASTSTDLGQKLSHGLHGYFKASARRGVFWVGSVGSSHARMAHGPLRQTHGRLCRRHGRLRRSP